MHACMNYVLEKDFVSIGNQGYSVLFEDSRFCVLCASFIFSENTVLGIGRMPRSLKISIEAARLLEKEIIRIADFCSFISLELRVKD